MAASKQASDLLRIEDLGIAFALHHSDIDAVKNASFRILPGKVTALVGESGSGKSVIAQAIMGILPLPGRITGGRILFHDTVFGRDAIDLVQLDPSGAHYRAIRGSRIAMIFQEPMTSLSPLHTIGDQIGEALQVHDAVSRPDERRRTEEMLELVGFPDPHRAYDMYPFELSGGLRQRAMIAMALICRPALLIADEPTTALDVTIQAQILQLLKDLQHKLNMAVLIITHDLGVVANIADEVVVIYHGEIMEAGTVTDIFAKPSHAYLKGLMAAVPHFDMKPGQRLKALREADVDASLVLGTRIRRRRPGRKPSGALLVGAQSHQDVHDAQVGLVRVMRRHRHPGGRRRELQHPARRVPRPRRRERLRQDHGQQADHARADTRCGRNHLRRRRRPDRRAKRRRRGAAEPAHPHPDGLPGSVQLAQSAHDGAEHPARAAGNP